MDHLLPDSTPALTTTPAYDRALDRLRAWQAGLDLACGCGVAPGQPCGFNGNDEHWPWVHWGRASARRQTPRWDSIRTEFAEAVVAGDKALDAFLAEASP